MISIDIEGMDELLLHLDDLKKDLMEGALAGLAQGAVRVQEQAKAICPFCTGELKNSITTRSKQTAEGVEAEATAVKDYAVYVEMGWGARGEENHADISPKAASEVTYNTKYTGHAAQPFMYPAYKATKPQVLELFKEAVERAMEG